MSRGPLPDRRNVLITGADTPIGERLARVLIADSRVDRILAVCGGDAELYPLADNPRVRAIQVNLVKSRRVRELLFGPARDEQIHVVVHLAMHRGTRMRGSRAHAFNVEALRGIIELAERHPTIERLVLRSDAAVYRSRRDLPVLIGEEHPLNIGVDVPQWVRDRVEADVTACARMGLSQLQIVVLRMAEVLAPGTGSQVFDWLESPVCFRPAGFDPMINLLSLDDATGVLQKAVFSDHQGVFNIPGADTLPLTACIRAWGRLGIPIAEPVMGPLYRMRSRITGRDFSYGINRGRFHFSGVLDGARAREVLRFVPAHPIDWPVA
jgi:UDP-glucose 4-epimerase